MTFWETIERGEYVMFALAVLFILIICIWWVRSAKLRKGRKGYDTLMQRVKDHLTEGDLENAGQICEASGSPGAQILAEGITLVGHPITDVVVAMQDAADIRKRNMEKGQRWLKAIAVISPLLGLGGTLVGVIDRLRDLGESGVAADTALLAAAIAPTIVTTVAGLGVGVFSLFAATFLDASISKSKHSLDEIREDFIRLLNQPA